MGAINYDDERFAEVETEKQQALTENEQLYSGMVDKAGQFYQNQIDATKEWTDKQQQLQQEQTDFAIEQIEQQKAQAEKDYKKEQSGAYVDYQKQSGKYGAEAEQMAAGGLTNTGFSESSQVSMYNTYQNRMATARQSYNQAVLNYNNAIKDAQLQNSSVLAEIAFNGLQQQLQYALEGFQYENSLLIEQANKIQEINHAYYGRYQDVVDQINQENALAEQIRQYNEQMEYQKAQDERNYQLQLQQIAYQKEQDERNYQLQLQQLAEEQRQFNTKQTTTSATINKNSGDQQIKTQYYSGPIAENVGGYGYMGKDENGVAYQPKGVYVLHNGQYVPMKLEKTGKTAQQMFGKGSTNSSRVNIDKQNVWKAGGFYFVWNGTKNEYDCVGRVK